MATHSFPERLRSEAEWTDENSVTLVLNRTQLAIIHQAVQYLFSSRVEKTTELEEDIAAEGQYRLTSLLLQAMSTEGMSRPPLYHEDEVVRPSY